MSINERDRRKVHNKLVDIIGQPEADLIMDLFPSPDLTSQIAELRGELHIELAGLRAEFKDDLSALRTEVKDDIAQTRVSIAELQSDTQIGFATIDTRFAQVDTKFESVNAKMAELRAEMHHGFRSQTIWMVATMLTLAGVLVAAFATFS